MFVSTGLVNYSPRLIGNSDEKWWLVLQCGSEIGKYYRRLYDYLTNNCRKIQAPGWKDHITIGRNEKPPDEFQSLWGKYEGLEVEFEYNSVPRTNGQYYWLDVKCDWLLDLREELGLPREPEFKLHLTIGNNINL